MIQMYSLTISCLRPKRVHVHVPTHQTVPQMTKWGVSQKQRPIKQRPEDPKTLRPQKFENEDPIIFQCIFTFSEY